MKKNMLFSIALCIGLMLPAMSLAAEVGPQTWYGRITGAFSSTNETIQNYLSGWATSLVSRLSDNQKYALYAALAAALGTAGYAIYSRSQGQNNRNQTAAPYEPTSLNLNNPYDPNNMRNTAQFLYNAQFKSEESQNKEFFKKNVLPVLNLLENDLPKKPQSLIGTDAKKYYVNTVNFWINFMSQVANNTYGISLPHSDESYLSVISLQLEDDTPLKDSIDDALLKMRGISLVD